MITNVTESFTIDHNGYTATLEYRPAANGCRSSWWLHLVETPFPIGDGDRKAAADKARDQFIGAPPPADHSKIWGGYACACGATGVKLWRDYQTVLDAQTLRCRACAEAHEGKPARAGSDQIGWSVPAVPTPDGSTFWGYTSVPLAAGDWWRALPG